MRGIAAVSVLSVCALGATTVARGSMWRLESPNRLVIEFGEERAGERPAIATRTYMNVTPQ